MHACPSLGDPSVSSANLQAESRFLGDCEGVSGAGLSAWEEANVAELLDVID